MTREKVLKYFYAGLIWISIYFSSTLPFLLTVGFFVIADMVSGIISARKKGEVMQSRKLKQTVYKFIAYGIAIMVSFLIEKQFLGDFPGMKLISGFIAYVELKSINENIQCITGVNLFKSILEKMTPNQPPKTQ